MDPSKCKALAKLGVDGNLNSAQIPETGSKQYRNLI
jgi:hypothetical protein